MSDREHTCPHCHRGIEETIKNAVIEAKKESSKQASNKRLNSPDSRTIDENFEFSMVGGRYTGPNGEKMICVP